MESIEDIKAAVLNRIDESRNEAVELLVKLVQADSSNPPGDTRKAADVIVKAAGSFTENCKIISKEDVAPNIFITLNPGKKPQLLYNGHLDTVPPGDDSHWEVGPFSGEIRNNSVFGRGALDMKGGVAAMMMAAKALSQERAPLKGSLVLNFVSDEEVGAIRGTQFLMDNNHYSPDMVVVGEPTLSNRISLCEKGIVIMGLTVKGRAAHASMPWLGVNAIDKTVKILYAINSKVGEKLKDRPTGVLTQSTINVGKIQGGMAFNIVPEICETQIDRRILPSETVESAVAEIQQVIDELKKEDPEIDATLSCYGAALPFNTNPSEYICRKARETLEELHIPVEPVGFAAVCDGRIFADKGIPTIIIGPGLAAETVHGLNEYLEIDEYIQAIKVYALLAINALS
jgi:succinyl-diaminopimelate desuccinylase